MSRLCNSNGFIFMLSYIYPYERQTHASLLVELGFQPLEIKDRLGHEKIVTTLDTYSHLYPNKQMELADRLELENQVELEAVKVVMDSTVDKEKVSSNKDNLPIDFQKYKKAAN